MIHHISFAVRNPIHVADVLAEILDAQVAPAPPNFPKGSRFVIPGDAHGTLLEVLPYGSELRPDDPEAGFYTDVEPNSSFVATHAYISINKSEEELMRIGEREGWLTRRCDRGLFELIELWIENRLMLELAPPKMASQYLGFFSNPEAVQAAIAELSAN
jgi:hypothetical protein